MRTVVRLIRRVTDALDLPAAARARLAIAAVNGHALAESRYFLGEPGARLGPQSLGPFEKDLKRCVAESDNLFRLEFRCQSDRRQAGAMQNLIGIRIANAAEKPRIGERAF